MNDPGLRRCLVVFLDPATDEIEVSWDGMSVYEAWGVLKSALMFIEDQAALVTEPEEESETEE